MTLSKFQAAALLGHIKEARSRRSILASEVSLLMSEGNPQERIANEAYTRLEKKVRTKRKNRA